MSKKSTPTSYLLAEYQELLGESPSKLLQECATRWWSILLMFKSVLKNQDPLIMALSKDAKNRNLLNSEAEYKTMSKIVKLLEPFKSISETLCSETQVTSSL